MTTAMQTIGSSAPPVAWEQEMIGARYLLKSGLCPDALKTPEAVLFVILAGRDLGLSPVASLRGITIIKGKIECSADLQLSLFHRATGRSRWEELTDQRAALRLEAPWLSAPHVSVFTMADAQRGNLVSDTYRRFPKAMLRSRAITQGLKDIGFDATAGCYAPGEISGIEPVAAAVTVVDEDPQPQLPPNVGQWLTGAEMKDLKRDAVAAGIDSPDAWKAFVLDTVRDWTPTRGLTTDEAIQLRARMSADPDPAVTS